MLYLGRIGKPKIIQIGATAFINQPFLALWCSLPHQGQYLPIKCLPYSGKVWWGKSLVNWASRSFGEEKFGECRWSTGRHTGLTGFNWWMTCNFAKFANFPHQTFPLYGNYLIIIVWIPLLYNALMLLVLSWFFLLAFVIVYQTWPF